MLIVFVVLGAIAGLAAFVGVIVAISVFCCKGGGEDLKGGRSAELPLNDREKGELSGQYKQPPAYE